MKEDVGILDLISDYQKSFQKMWSERLNASECKRLMAVSGCILSESLSSFA